MKKFILAVLVIVALLGAYIAGTYAPLTCHKIDLMNDGTFYCDGQLIQGRPQAHNVVKSEWYWIN